MNPNRSSGVLLPIFSLPGDFGCGDFGKGAYAFIDLLKACGFHYWQVLPFTRTDDCNSPYKSDSAFAGNCNFIDLYDLQKMGLLQDIEIKAQLGTPDWRVSYDWLNKTRKPLLQKAFSRADAALKADIAAFAQTQDWLSDYALYMVLKDKFDCEWMHWEDKALRDYEPQAIKTACETYQAQMEYYFFEQYIFSRQWEKVKAYAHQNEVYIIGDMPIYVSFESADCWSKRSLFDLDEKGSPASVAGVPPDYFSKTGQKWGNPLYNWSEMRKDSYQWWKQRLHHTLKMVDKVRIDHFRAFSAYWAVPAEAEFATEGKWVDGEGMKFFDEIFKTVSKEAIIAEDLGIQDAALTTLLKDSALPGMRVLQFGFLNYDDDMHLPHNYPHNMVCYTGTHDNKPLLAYLWELTPEQRAYCLRYCGFQGEDWKSGGAYNKAIRAILKTLWKSHSMLVISPIQDLLGYGGDTTMNQPGTSKGNWSFRMTPEAIHAIDITYLKNLNDLYKRS
ncbi:MAG: 4-alpha-glucanotransferase [Clostridia bacterium]|nr:4-alpha-glucanotransferase [Clostridia bacterium]